MSLAEMVRKMASAGASPEAIAIALEAIEAEQAKDAARRAKRAEQKRKERDSRATVERPASDVGETVAADPLSLDKEIPPTPPKENKPFHPVIVSEERAGVSGDFAEFYAAYPKRENRKGALSRYESSRKAGVSHERIMAGLIRWGAKWAADRTECQFIPAPDVWLNKGKFDDEPSPNSRAGPRISRGTGKPSVQDAIRDLKNELFADPEPDMRSEGGNEVRPSPLRLLSSG